MMLSDVFSPLRADTSQPKMGEIQQNEQQDIRRTSNEGPESVRRHLSRAVYLNTKYHWVSANIVEASRYEPGRTSKNPR